MSVTVSEHLKANYEDYYDEGTSEWRRVGALGKADNIVALCSGLPRTSILEIGAGEGSVLKRLAELEFGEKLFALEISSSGVEAIKNRRLSRLVECKVFDGYHIPYENDRFDIAILSHVIEHVEHPRLLLYEAARVARHVFIEVPLEDTIRLPYDFIFSKVGHINVYSPKTIRHLVQSCNIRLLRQITTNASKETYRFRRKYRGLIHYYIKAAALMVMPGVATRMFTYHAALLCEKNPSDPPARL